MDFIYIFMHLIDEWKISNAVIFYFPTVSNNNMLDARMCETGWTLSQLMKSNNHNNHSNRSSRSSHSLLHSADVFIKAIRRARRVQIECKECMWKSPTMMQIVTFPFGG